MIKPGYLNSGYSSFPDVYTDVVSQKTSHGQRGRRNTTIPEYHPMVRCLGKDCVYVISGCLTIPVKHMLLLEQGDKFTDMYQ